MVSTLPANQSTYVTDFYPSVADYVTQRSRTFRLAAKLLPSDRRRIATIIYAFFRRLDDMVDEEHISLAEFRAWRSKAEGQADQQTDSILAAWADVRERYGIDPQLIENMLDGIEMDVAKRRYTTLDDLYTYCHRVATSGAFLALYIVRLKAGYSHADVMPQVEQLALGVQLTDILCDIAEDAANGRIYLPEEILTRFGLTYDDIERGVYDERFKDMVRHVIGVARNHFVEGWPVLNCFPAAERLAAGFMALYHWASLDKIERADFNIFAHPITFSTKQKLWLLLSYLPRYLFMSKRPPISS